MQEEHFKVRGFCAIYCLDSPIFVVTYLYAGGTILALSYPKNVDPKIRSRKLIDSKHEVDQLHGCLSLGFPDS